MYLTSATANALLQLLTSEDTMIEDWINRQDELEEGVFKRLDEVSEPLDQMILFWAGGP